jgi:hypothetical protein
MGRVSSLGSASPQTDVIVTPYFVFVHVPKTGGQFVRTIVERHYPVSWRGSDHHSPYAELPERYRELPALAFVRNPWDCYVSTWAFMRDGEGDAPLRLKAQEGFRPFMLAAQGRIAQGRGLAWRFEQMTDGMEVRRYEDGLSESLRGFLHDHDVPVTDELLSDLEDHPRVNVSAHEPYASYYDAETTELVRRECRGIIDRFGYSLTSSEPDPNGDRP